MTSSSDADPPMCETCHHARHVHAMPDSDWYGCRVIGCDCDGWSGEEPHLEDVTLGPRSSRLL